MRDSSNIPLVEDSPPDLIDKGSMFLFVAVFLSTATSNLKTRRP